MYIASIASCTTYNILARIHYRGDSILIVFDIPLIV